MPEFEDKEFKFPDEQPEVKANAEDKLEIEIEDDTPAEDRNRQPMPKELVEELDKDDLESYDENVKQKLKQMRKVWHDERRAKEAAYREQQEAVALAQRALEENKRYKDILSTGESEYKAAMEKAAQYELEIAKRAYKDAYDAGDTDRVIEAQQAMQQANLRIAQVQNFKVSSLQTPETSVQTQYQEPTQQAPVNRPDPRASRWQQDNPWFGQDEEMTAAALGLHEKLKRNGVVVGSDEYYSTLDKTMRKRFDEYFGESEPPKEKSEPAPTKPSTVVAPATRSTSSNKIRLKASQVQLAKKLGLTPEQYAQAALKLER
jgi:hypothetical protein